MATTMVTSSTTMPGFGGGMARAVVYYLQISVFAVMLSLLIPIDGMMLGTRIYYHFVANEHFQPSREPLVMPSFPFNASQLIDVESILRLHDRLDGGERPEFEVELTDRTLGKISTMSDGHNLYLPFTKRWHGDPDAYDALNRARKQLIEPVQDHVLQELGLRVYPVTEASVWSAFTIQSRTTPNSIDPSFGLHYDAEPPNAFRAIFVISGGDDCDMPSVRYQDKEGQFHNITVRTGDGYFIRGSETRHGVQGGGCNFQDSSVLSSSDDPSFPASPFPKKKKVPRVILGLQFSTLPNQTPVSLCSHMLAMQAKFRCFVRHTTVIVDWLSKKT